jgi:hypothetical protein
MRAFLFSTPCPEWLQKPSNPIYTRRYFPGRKQAKHEVGSRSSNAVVPRLYHSTKSFLEISEYMNFHLKAIFFFMSPFTYLTWPMSKQLILYIVFHKSFPF